MREHPPPTKPLSKVFPDSAGEQALHGVWSTAQSQSGCPPPPGVFPVPSLRRAAGLLLPRTHWSLTFFVSQFLL